MQLKSVELYGFKSFADKTLLNFGEGITAIVGPNGCGKTNITDAIKWVLGEQSAKSLRGTKMEDVIFNGTASRKATSISEITLQFDNSKNVLPIDYSEVSVTRRLYRSGESEYLLNKTPVRLKDIKNLFLDTGVGTNSYSIMEQGKIDFILQAKPEERRFLFEEVAGVAKYKSKREEALRKLEKVGQDMLRLNDILVELESQKSKLDLQARKARQYQKCLNELKTYEVNSLVKKYLEVKDINAEKRKELEIANEKQTTASNEIDRVDAKYSELKLNLTAKEDELILKRTEANKIDSLIQILKVKISAAEEGKIDFLKRNEEAQKDIQQGGNDLNNYKADHKNTNKKLAEYEKTVSSSNEMLSKKTDAKNELEEEISRLASETETVRQEIFNTATAIAELRNKNSAGESFLEELNQRIEKTEIQKEQTLSRKIEKEKIFGELKIKIGNIEKSLEEKRKEAEDRSARKEQLEQTIEKLRNEFLQKKNVSAQLNARMDALTRDSNYALNLKIKETFGNKIYGTVSDVISVKDGDIPLVQAALGEKSDYLICDMQETAAEIINWLKDRPSDEGGWSVFLILSDIEKIRISQPLVFAGTMLTDFVSCKSKFKKAVEFLLSNTALNNDNLCSPGIIQGGKITSSKRGGLETTSEINRLKNEISNVNGGIAETESLIRSSQDELSGIETELKTNFEATENYKNELIVSTKDFAAADESLKTSANFLEVLSAEYENSLKQKTEKEENIRGMKKLLEEEQALETSAKSRFSGMTDRSRKCQEEFKNAARVITDMKVEFSTKNSELLHLREKIKGISENIETVNLQIKRANNFLQDSCKKLAEFEKTINKSSEEINRIVVSKDTMDDLLKDIERECGDIKTGMLDVETTLRNLRIRQQEIQDETRGLERTVSGTSSEIRQIETRIKEEKEIEIKDAVDNYQEIMISQEEIEKIKKKITSLGAVNLAAPEEYEQLEQRYNFLLKQKNDLEKAREDLHKAINKINITTRQQFQKTFVIVQENFRKIFNRLFEGGEADLLLTDSDNLLETGIDIIAQPPGKKLQHISLLSGGERALTAIALLFAIYLVKPAPFCILDEIDGHLDEANILRFTRMLKEFAKGSQFLVITHNKRTMESANVLYGVTMEELGISKIISVQLEGAKTPVS